MNILKQIKNINHTLKERRLEYLAGLLIKVDDSDIVYATYRFFIYGITTMFLEISFYTLIKIFRNIPGVNFFLQFEWVIDPKLNLHQMWNTPAYLLFGQSSLYMFFVYGLICLFWCEFVFKKMYDYPFFIRGIFYAIGISFFELLSGWILFWITGYKIWYYTDKWAFFQFTSFSIWGIWFFISLFLFEPVMVYFISKKKKNEFLKDITSSINYRKYSPNESMSFFLKIFSAELSRAKRNKTSFLLFHIHFTLSISENILKILHSSLREEDILCSIDQYSNFILFPETSEISKETLYQKIALILNTDEYFIKSISIVGHDANENSVMNLKKCHQLLNEGNLTPDSFMVFLNSSF